VETFALVVDGAEVPLAEGARRVLAFLALGNGLVIRSYVAYTLWPDTPEFRSLGYLRAALWRLRKVGDDLVDESMGRLRMSADVRVDVREARDLARHILAGGEPGPVGEACHRLSRGDLLADWYEPWLTEPREQLRQLRLHALEELSGRQLARGYIPAAIESALAAVAAEPLRESAHRLLIRAHLAEANAAEALRQYEQFRALLFGELGILPSTRIEDLLTPIRGGRVLRAG
jgi:DNA-binding SARP family transcriptional activator